MLAVLGDSVTTINLPSRSIKRDSPAGKYLVEHGVKPAEFDSTGCGAAIMKSWSSTFANVRLRNKTVPSLEGGLTRHLPDGAEMSIFDASKIIAEDVPLVIPASGAGLRSSILCFFFLCVL